MIYNNAELDMRADYTGDQSESVVSFWCKCPRCQEWSLLATWRRKGNNTAIDGGGDSVTSGYCESCKLDIVMDLAGAIAGERGDVDLPAAEEGE